MTEKTELINYTLRFPEEYRKRLEIEAQARGRSLNQQIVRIIEMYFAGAGYSSNLISSGGQMFQVHSALAHDTQAETVWEFLLENFKTGKEEAHYMIGVDKTFIKDLKVSDRLQASKEVGLALLNFYAKKNRDVRSLSWTQNQPFDGKRVISFSEIPDNFNLETFPDFLEHLNKGQWQDRYIVPDEEFEALKTLLITARMERAPIVKHMDDEPGRIWIQIGDKNFDGRDKDLYLKALSRMGFLHLVVLQPMKDRSLNTYFLTQDAIQYLAKIASWTAA